MRITHTRKILLAALGLAAALSLTACDGTGTRDEGAADSASTAPSGKTAGTTGGPTADATAGGNGGSASGTGSSGSSTTGGTAGSGSGSGTSSKASMCRTDELEVYAVDNTTDKKEGVVTVQFKNGGGRACSVNGYAGVDLKTADGSTISVDRNGEKAYPSVLKDGESAAFNITFPVNNTGGSGVRPTKILVTPPNETKYVSVAWPAGSLPASDGSDGSDGVRLAIGPANKVSDSPAG
ncbi:DUF4232 domain-containing protein [Streptomyces sp. NPDC058371]|uniref:DUF4232 domain-containing protein n=1 Tax=Streptomyces sp. NPDC058371 TaxID=3346463 RepID=UPI0036485624